MLFIKENFARFYGEKSDESSYGKPVDVVQKIKDILPGGTVLDLGAGDGRHALYLAEQGFDVTAVDLSEEGLEKLQRHASDRGLAISTKLADLNTWSISDMYDVIISIVTLQHLKTESALRILQEMKDRTITGGLNVITAFTKTGDRYLLDREEDPNAFYPDDNWLQEFYGDWNIIESTFFNGTLIGRFRADGKPMQGLTVRLIAQKP